MSFTLNSRLILKLLLTSIFAFVLVFIFMVVFSSCGCSIEDPDLLSHAISIELETEHSGETVNLTIRYFGGWAATEEDNSIVVANSQAVLYASREPDFVPSEGQVVGEITFMDDVGGMGLRAVTVGRPLSASEMEAFLTQIAAGEDLTPPSSPTPELFTLNGRDGRIMRMNEALFGGENSVGQQSILVSVDNGYVVGTFTYAAGQSAQFEEQMRAITASGVAVITPAEP